MFKLQNFLEGKKKPKYKNKNENEKGYRQKRMEERNIYKVGTKKKKKISISYKLKF